jgi:hypothetical protein
MMATKKSDGLGRYCLVTTAHRGVFAGYLVGEPNKEKVMLKQCRNVLRWSQTERGFLGLAHSGPGKECRVGPAAPESTLYDITSCTVVTDEARAAFERGPWS